MSNITKLDTSALAAAAAFGDDFFEDKTGSSAPSFTTYTAALDGFSDQDDNTVSEVVGYTVHTRRQVALWLGDGVGEPALSSFDGEKWDKWDQSQLDDIGDPEAYKVPVDESPYMQWDKHPETGKSVKGKITEGGVLGAKETYILYVLQEGNELPVAVKVPAGSFRNLKGYKKELAKNKLTLPKVQTKFTIKSEKAGTNKWATVQFDAVGVVGTKEEWDAITTCAKLTQDTLSGFAQPKKEADPPF